MALHDTVDCCRVNHDVTRPPSGHRWGQYSKVGSVALVPFEGQRSAHNRSLPVDAALAAGSHEGRVLGARRDQDTLAVGDTDDEGSSALAREDGHYPCCTSFAVPSLAVGSHGYGKLRSLICRSRPTSTVSSSVGWC